VTATATDSLPITVNLIGDDVNEATEGLFIQGTTAGDDGLRVGARRGGCLHRQNAAVQITDDDAITVSVSAAESMVAEGGEAVFTVALDHESAADATVAFSAAIRVQTGLFANPDGNLDFTLAEASPLVIRAGQTQGTITVRINDDRLAENNEVLRLTVSGVTLGTFDDSGVRVTPGGVVSTTFPVADDVTIAPNAAAVYTVDFADDAPTTIAEGMTATSPWNSPARGS